jgi:hypothetical protein
MPLREHRLRDLRIRGERAFRAVAPYAALKRRLIDDGYVFLVLPEDTPHRDRATFLNHTYWSAADGRDVLVDAEIDADVVAHVAWHHLARRALPGDAPATAAAMFLGESVASAFDLYVVGQLLRTSPRADYLTTQVPAMSAAAEDAGLSPDDVAALFDAVVSDPEAAFEAVRRLLFDASVALYAAPDVLSAQAVLERFTAQPYGALLHHYALSTWVLFARAYAAPSRDDDPALAMDRAIRSAPVALDWLVESWVGR